MPLCIPCYINKIEVHTHDGGARCSSCAIANIDYDWDRFFKNFDKIESRWIPYCLNGKEILPVVVVDNRTHILSIWRKITVPEKFSTEVWSYNNLSYLKLKINIYKPEHGIMYVGGIITHR